ncbi:hypothetical protein JCM10212_000294 [Sporobolomyces blumeae]
MAYPSVLYPAPSTPHASTSFPPFTPLAPAPSTSTASKEPSHRCSQCKKSKPTSAFPIRLVNLEPYLVCLDHDWYWTQPKRVLHWAPDKTSELNHVIQDVKKIASGSVSEYEDRFMVNGRREDLDELVRKIAQAGQWNVKKVIPRPSRSKLVNKDKPPPPSFVYTLSKPASPGDNPQRLTMYYHHDAGKYTMTLRPDVKKPRSNGPWARPDRLKNAPPKANVDLGGKGKGKALEQDPQEQGGALSSATYGARCDERQPVDAQARPASASASTALSSAHAVAVQMPPPPVPPRKKPRRVEPSLVSPALPSPSSRVAAGGGGASSASAFSIASQASSLNPLAHFLSFPLDPVFATLPTPPVHFPTSQSHASAQRPSDSFAAPSASTLGSTLPSATSHIGHPYALTLAELLASPAFDPPNIPLPPRATRSSLPSSRTSGRGHSSTTKARGATRGIDVETNSAAGKELDDAVLLALGSSPAPYPRSRGQRRTIHEHGRDLEDDEQDDLDEDEDEDEEHYYEDSIPDDSTDDEELDDEEGDEEEDLDGKRPGRTERARRAREDEADEGDEDDDRDSVDSFFESSAEEDDDDEEEEEVDGEGSSGEEDLESDELDRGGEGDDEDDEDWLAGFVSKQMPGMGEGADAADDDDDDDDDEVHRFPRGRGTRHVARTGSAHVATVVEEEDEIDELASSGAE